MLIRSKIPNEPSGRTVDMGDGTVYHFAPKGGENVCEVTEPAHVSRLLSITEGYEDVANPTKAAPVVPQRKAVQDKPNGNPGDYNGLTRKQLVAAFKAKFGREPNSRSTDAAIVKALVER